MADKHQAKKSTTKTRIILAVLFFGILMGALDISIVGPAMPEISSDFEVGERGMAWVFSIYVLFNLVGISFLSRLSDIHGRRLLYIVSILIFAIGSLIAAFSVNFDMLLAGRAVQGFGSSGIFPVASAVIGDVFPIEKRGRALGMVGAVFGLAFIIGPLVAGLILLVSGWHMLFLINIPAAIVLIPLAWRYLPGKIHAQKRSFDFRGALLMGGNLAFFALAVNNIDPTALFNSLKAPYFLISFFAFLLLFAMFYKTEMRVAEPVVQIRLFRSRQLRLLGLIAIGLGLFQSVFVFIPQIAVQLFSVTTAQASFMLLPLVVATAIASPVAGRMTDRFGSRIVIAAGLAMAALATAVLAFYGNDKNIFLSAGAALGIGFSFRSSLNYIMLNEVPPSERASTQGILAVLVSVGQLSGAALIGALLANEAHAFEGIQFAFFYLFGLAFILMFLSLSLKSHKKEREWQGEI